MSEQDGTNNAPGGTPGTPATAQFDAGAAFTGLVSGLTPEGKGWLENKAYKDFPSLVEAHRGAEKMLGVPKDRLLALPEKMDDAKAMAPVWERLGRPKDVAGYKVPEGVDAERIKPFLGKLHEMGAPAGMVEAAFSAMVEMSKAAETETITAFNTASDNENAQLKKEWGQAYEQEVARGRRFAKEVGLGKPELDAIERVLGTGKTLKMFAKAGAQFSEDKLVGGGNGAQFNALSPEAAMVKIAELKGDKAFMDRLTSANAETKKQANAEWERLHRFAYPG